MNWMQIVQVVLASLVSALTIGLILRGALSRTVAKMFALDVFKALNDDEAKYRAFHERVFAGEFERGRRTADIALEVSRKLDQQIEEFSRFRSSYEGHQEMLILIPKAVADLERSVDRLNVTMAGVGAALGDVREDVAFLKGQTK